MYFTRINSVSFKIFTLIKMVISTRFPSLNKFTAILVTIVLCFQVLFISKLYYSSSLKQDVSSSNWTESSLCPLVPPNVIGRFEPDVSRETVDAVEKRFGDLLKLGGFYKPNDCVSRDKIAVITVCFRREFQLPIFLKNVHAHMMKQQLEYQIFVMTQMPGHMLNKAALYNVGFVEAMKIQDWDCIIFHDIDMVPMDERNYYDCPRINPRHLGVDIDIFGYKYNFHNNGKTANVFTVFFLNVTDFYMNRLSVVFWHFHQTYIKN